MHCTHFVRIGALKVGGQAAVLNPNKMDSVGILSTKNEKLNMNFLTYSGRNWIQHWAFLGGEGSNYVKDTEGSSKNQ